MKTLQFITQLTENAQYVEKAYIASRAVKDRIATRTGEANSYSFVNVEQYVNEKNIGGFEVGFDIVFREGSSFDAVKQYVIDSPEFEEEEPNTYCIILDSIEYILRIERSEPGDYFVLKFSKL